MKTLTIFLLLLGVSATTFSQETVPSPALTKNDYLKKSKTQNTVGWVLVGAGAGLIAVSFATTNLDDFGDSIFYGDDSGLNTGAALFVSGVVVAVSSIPLFIAAGKNKRKAMSISFKLQPVPHMTKTYLTNFKTPSLTLKVEL